MLKINPLSSRILQGLKVLNSLKILRRYLVQDIASYNNLLGVDSLNKTNIDISKGGFSVFINRRFVFTVAMVVNVSVLAGCNNTNVEQIIDMAMEQSQDDTMQTQYCQARTVPFVHSLCRVSQGSLTEPNSILSLKLFWRTNQISLNGNSTATGSDSMEPLYTFDTLLSALPRSSDLKFAANAGMYNTEFAPIGYTMMQGKQVLSMNLNDGAGNFHLMPNGVLWWNEAGNVYITESHKLDRMLKEGAANPWFATQSGPMLVINGDIHPKFNRDSDSKKLRNGVGVCDDGDIKFVNSDKPVTFYQFARLFKDDLKCPNALFLDGGIASALYAPDIGRHDAKNMGVMVGLIENISQSKSEN